MKPDPLSATARKEAAREATKAAVGRELMWASIGSRWWPSYLFKPAVIQATLPAMLCIESPAGPICYRLSMDELELFAHITDRRETGPKHYTAGEKEGTLLALATDGWE